MCLFIKKSSTFATNKKTMGKINFKPGEFITHLTMPNCFAIYGGEELPSTDGNDSHKDYTLICYCNLAKTNSANSTYTGPQIKDIIRDVFDADIDGNLCQYVLSEKDSFWWRRCNSDEKFKALKTLAEKYNLAWDDKMLKLRHLGPNEKLMAGNDNAESRKPKTRTRTERVPNRISPYGGTRVIQTSYRNNNTTTVTTHTIDKTVITTAPKGYKQAKKIAGQNIDMIRSLAHAASEVNRKEAVRYTNYNYRNPVYRSPYDNYDEFWGD